MQTSDPSFCAIILGSHTCQPKPDFPVLYRKIEVATGIPDPGSLRNLQHFGDHGLQCRRFSLAEEKNRHRLFLDDSSPIEES